MAENIKEIDRDSPFVLADNKVIPPVPLIHREWYTTKKSTINKFPINKKKEEVLDFLGTASKKHCDGKIIDLSSLFKGIQRMPVMGCSIC